MNDATETISTATRTLGARTLAAGEARVMAISRVYPTGQADLWEACTSAERLPRWFLPVTGDLRVGGRFQLQGNAGGTIERCDPPHGFAATWEMGEAVSWIEVRLTAQDEEHTRLELEHVAHVDERWDEYGPGAVGIGWDLGLYGLLLHLRSGAAVDAEAFMAWSASPEGIAFMTALGEAWRAADVAGGTDPDDARARADRTIAFYTGA